MSKIYRSRRTVIPQTHFAININQCCKIKEVIITINDLIIIIVDYINNIKFYYKVIKYTKTMLLLAIPDIINNFKINY